MTKQPTIGTVFAHPTLGRCKVIAIHPLGTIDVQNIFTDRCYRISGLPMNAGSRFSFKPLASIEGGAR